MGRKYVHCGIGFYPKIKTKSIDYTKSNMDNKKNTSRGPENSKVNKHRNFTKRYTQSRNLLALLEKQRGADLKAWQNLEPHYTDLLEEQLKTRRKINYLESVANFGHINVRNVYMKYLPLNILVGIGLMLAPVNNFVQLYAAFPLLFKICVFSAIALGLTNVPLAIAWRRWQHDISYRNIQDKLGITIFEYFEIVEKDKNIDGGYTKKEITEILKRFVPKLPYTADEIANYLQGIIEIEIERKSRGLVYYLYLKEDYFDEIERKRQTPNK